MGIVVWLAWAVRPAAACGGFVHADDDLAESDAAEAIFEEVDGHARVSYAVRWAGDATDFGWVVPVPGAFVGIADADPGRFDELREETDPEVVADAPKGGGGCACGGASKAGGTRSGGSNGTLDVVAEGFTGTYEYVAITAEEPEALAAWFTDHGWVGLDPDDVDRYVALGHTFVALRVRPDAAPSSEMLLPPVSIDYDGPLAYPAALLRHASAPEQRTTLYVLGDGLAELDGWTAAEVPVVAGGLSDSALALFEDELLVHGVDRGYLRTWAGAHGDGFLTRFDTRAPRDAHTADVGLRADGPAREVRTVISLGAGDSGAAPTGAGLLLPPGVAGLAAAVGRRRAQRPPTRPRPR